MTAKFAVLLIMARVVGVPGVAGWSAGVLAAGRVAGVVVPSRLALRWTC